MAEKKKAVPKKAVVAKKAKPVKKEEGCSGQCWCCGGHDKDEDEE